MIEEYFSSVSGEDDWTPRYNIAPPQPVPVIRQNPKEPRRELSLISTRINHVANDDEECSRPIEGAPIQNRLFA
jgi:hypothetical protein